MAIPQVEPSLFRDALGGDPTAQNAVAQQLYEPVLELATKLTHGHREDGEDVAHRTWELLLRTPLTAFNRAHTTPAQFVGTLVRRALRDVRAQNAPPGHARRARADSEAFASEVSLDDVVPGTAITLGETLAVTYSAEFEIEHAAHRLDTETFIRGADKRHGPRVAEALRMLANGEGKAETACAVGLSRFQLERRLRAVREAESTSVLLAA